MISVLKQSICNDQKVDDVVMEAIANKKKLEREFMLREDLLEAIKKGRARVALMQKKVEE